MHTACKRARPHLRLLAGGRLHAPDRLEAGFAFSRPKGPPRLTREEAIDLATGKMPGKPHVRADYVRCKNLHRHHGIERSDGTLHYSLLPPFDAWKITVNNVWIPRPGGRSGTRHHPPPVTRMLIIIDDKRAEYHGAVGE